MTSIFGISSINKSIKELVINHSESSFLSNFNDRLFYGLPYIASKIQISSQQNRIHFFFTEIEFKFGATYLGSYITLVTLSGRGLNFRSQHSCII